MHRGVLFLIAIAPMIGGCVSYEYEEEVFLNVDGSGRLRVSGSSVILESLYDTTGGSAPSMRPLFESVSFELDSVRATERLGRRFVHVQGRFADWNDVCSLPAFRERECRLDVNAEGSFELRFMLPSPRQRAPEDVPPDAVLAVRFHFPSPVQFHNSSTGIERGNIIAWKRTVSEHFRSEALDVHARFEPRSVLATTVVILGTAIGVVLLSVTVALLWMARKGRKQLAREAEPSSSGSGDVETRTPTAQGQ